MARTRKQRKNETSEESFTQPADDSVTQGQRSLRAVNASHSEVAGRVGCSKTLVSYWRSGQKAPSPDMRRKLEALYKIPVGSWDESTEVRPSRESEAPKEEAPPAPSGGRISTEAEAANRLAELQRLRSRPSLSIREVVQCIAAETAVLKVIREIQSDEEMTESRIVASEPHQRLVRAVLAALEPYPEALRAVVHAMEGRA